MISSPEYSIFFSLVPSFPYGWCLKNFLGEDSDAVSWDFSMNEGDNADGKTSVGLIL
jgi:hypothetical protein